MNKKLGILIIWMLTLLLLNSCRRGKINVNDYGYFVNNCTAPYQVDFYTDVDYVGKKIHFLWDFGDGTTSEEQNPSHYYNKKGKYKVSLSIENYRAQEQISMLVDVSLDTMMPIANFDYQIDSNNFAPAQVRFYNYSQYASEYFWNFGDGYGSNEIEPVHIYDSAGTYTVKLDASCQGHTSSKTKSITILPPPQKITIDEVIIWLPDEYIGGVYELRYYVDNYDDTPLLLDKVIADDFPIGWQLYDELEYFDGEYDNSYLYFELWEEHDHYAPVYDFGIKFSEIQQLHYPSEILWDNGDFAAKIYLSYE